MLFGLLLLFVACDCFGCCCSGSIAGWFPSDTLVLEDPPDYFLASPQFKAPFLGGPLHF